MKGLALLLNVIWFLLGGWMVAIEWFIGGLVLAITIVGLPYVPGIWRIAVFSAFPFGQDIVSTPKGMAGKTFSGIFNILLNAIGLPSVDWLGNKNTALMSVLLLTGWRAIGYGMIIYLSALQGINKNYYEAANIAGATYFQKLRYVTIPMLSPTTLFLFVTTFLSSMKVFQSVDILTAGGPYRSTEVFVYKIYSYAMEDFRMDRASVMALAFFVLLLLITAFTMKISNNKVNYDS